MSKNNHHYVSKFLMRYFATDRHENKEPRLINLFNLQRRKIIKEIGLADQCYQKKFYGKTDEVEDHLMALEGKFAGLASEIQSLQNLPPKNSYEYELLLGFVVTQYLRTKRESDLQNEMFDGFYKSLLEATGKSMSKEELATTFGENYVPPNAAELKDYQIEIENIPENLLAHTPEIIPLLKDLEPLLIISPDEAGFILSDNPVIKYNQFYEDIKKLTNNGFLSRGVQIFFPLSPKVLLLLFDPSVYCIDGTSNIIKNTTKEDMYFMNLLQYINADENIYFDNSNRDEAILAMDGNGERYRKSIKTINQKLGGPGSYLFFSMRMFPKIKLNLSFLKLRESAKKISMKNKYSARYRDEN